MLRLLVLVAACGDPPPAVASPAPVPASSPSSSASKSSPPTVTPGDADVVATWEGGSLTYGDVRKELGHTLAKLETDYLNQRYEAESNALDRILVLKLLDEEAKARKLADVTALVKAEVDAKVSPPSEAEIAEFYPVMQRHLGYRPLADVRDQVAAEVLVRKQQERFAAFVDELKAKRKVVKNLTLPDLPRIPVDVGDDPVRGEPHAKVTIVQFAEYQCPACGAARPVLDQVMDEYDGKVRMVFKDFPLSFHPSAMPAAVAANCAGQQGKYWQMSDTLMMNQGALGEDALQRYAKDLGLDAAKWSACRKDPAQSEEVQADLAYGIEIGIEATPTFFVNGVMFQGVPPIEQLRAVIDRELAL